MKKLPYATFILALILEAGCNWTSKQQNLKKLCGKQFCLDVSKTEEVNKITIGKGKLTLNEDMTFAVMNDSVKYSNIKGSWDICCYDSDFGNYVFKVKGMQDWKTSSPEFYVKVDNRDIRLIFTSCE